MKSPLTGKGSWICLSQQCDARLAEFDCLDQGLVEAVGRFIRPVPVNASVTGGRGIASDLER